MGQLLLRWGIAIIAFVALFLGIDRTSDWSRDFSQQLSPDLGLWLQAIGLLLLAGAAFGIALWLPVPGRGGRPSVLLGLGIPILLLNVGYAAVFHMDLEDLPDFIASRLGLHPVLSIAAASTVALLLGLVLVSGFRPAGYVSVSRLDVPQQHVQQPYTAPAPAAPPPPPPATVPAEPREGSGTSPERPDNQQTRRLPRREA